MPGAFFHSFLHEWSGNFLGDQLSSLPCMRVCGWRWLIISLDHKTIGWGPGPGKPLSHTLQVDDIVNVRDPISTSQVRRLLRARVLALPTDGVDVSIYMPDGSLLDKILQKVDVDQRFLLPWRPAALTIWWSIVEKICTRKNMLKISKFAVS